MSLFAPALISRKLLLLSVCANATLLLFGFTPMREVLKNVINPPVRGVPRYSLEHFNFHKLPETNTPNITVLGDSIVKQADFVALLGRADVVNRGIAGDFAIDMPKRLDYLLFKRPKVMFIEGGINDLANGVLIEDVVRAKSEVLDFCVREGITPIIVQTMKVAKVVTLDFKPPAVEMNLRVDALNASMEKVANKRGIRVFDVNPTMTQDGYLRADLTTDGVHLNAEGTRLMGEGYRTALKGFKL